MIELLNIDCMDYLATCEDNAFQLAIVDPPYGISVNVNMGRRRGDKPSNYKKFAGEDKKIPSKEYFEQLFRVSANQIVWGGNYMTEHLPPSSCWLLWDKKFSEDVTFAQYELAWSSFTTSAKKFDKHPSQQHRIHPTQKPVKLYEWLLMNYAEEGDRILDTHLGSGSSAIACHNLGFDFVGCEMDKDYYNAALKRYRQHAAQLTIPVAY
jgi:site-specific DNA-methyltransferase (adenine-specific)